MAPDEATTPEVETTEVPKGKVLQTFLIRLTLRENSNMPLEEYTSREDAIQDVIPTNDTLKRIVEDAVYDQIPYFYSESINATVEKV